MDCTVCGKPAAEGANVCSISCMMKIRQGGDAPEDKVPSPRKPRVVGKSVSHLTARMQELLKQPISSTQEVSMLILKHSRLKGRNVVINETVFSFDMNGIAKVKDLGSARSDLEALLQRDSQVVVQFDPKKPQEAPQQPQEAAPAASVSQETTVPQKRPEPAVASLPQVETHTTAEPVSKPEAAPVSEEPIRRPVKRRAKE